LFRDRRVKDGPTLAEFWGQPQDHQEVPLRIVRGRGRRIPVAAT
jgi:anaerobic magnesium-protoporphyrin IX monomethyl ester cyclase